MLHEQQILLDPLTPAVHAGCDWSQPLNPLHVNSPKQRRPSALTIVAHDLRGPLASLGMLVELIETHCASRSLDKIASCADRASNIIDSLEHMLNSVLERVQTTGDPLGFEPDVVEIDQIIRAGIAMNRPAAENKSVNIIFRLTDPMRVNGDPRLLSQVIENLVGNAIKHSSVGMTVTCALYQTGSQAVIEIADTGNGLTKLDLQRAFRPFTTLSSKSKDSSRSWGLGLWIVKLIVEQHGGQISVTSPGRGSGTVFRICLPT
jgi:signal transduction histidine kinase